MSQQPAPNDDSRDAHLIAALRHAPDRDLAPPPQLTAAILDQAQRALRARPRRPQSAWHAAWARLWQPAPMAAFGTLAMATLIGVLWGGREVPDATPSLRPAPAAAPAEPAAASGLAIPPALLQAPPPAATARDALAAESPPTKPMPRQVPKTSATAKAADPALASPAPAAAHERQAVAQEPESRRDAAAAPLAAPPTPAPVAAAGTVAGSTGALQRDLLGKSMADATPARARSERPAPAPAPQQGSPLLAANAEIEAALRGDAARVRWRLPTQRVLAHDAAQRGWWAAVVRDTEGRWQAAGAAPTGAAEGAALTLLIDATPRGSIAFEPQALVWRDAAGTTWRATVAAEMLGRWQALLARW